MIPSRQSTPTVKQVAMANGRKALLTAMLFINWVQAAGTRNSTAKTK